jgi:hypothetical protein
MRQMKAKSLIVFAFALLAIPANVLGQAKGCIEGSAATMQNVMCSCTGITKMAGNCGSGSGNSLCLILQSTPCSLGCTFEYLTTVTSHGVCEVTSLKAPKMPDLSLLPDLWQEAKVSNSNVDSCAGATTAFRDWLAHELNKAATKDASLASSHRPHLSW